MEFFSPPTPYKAPTALYDLTKHLGLTTSLTWVVDAGDARSNTFGQTLLQQPAGAPTITLGNDASVDAFRDPTPVGVQGRQSTGEYWSTTCSAAGSPANRLGIAGTWMNAMHQDSATFTMCGVFRRDSTSNGWGMFGDCGGDAASIGVTIAANSSGGFGGFPIDRLVFSNSNGSGSAYAAAFGTSSMTVPRGTDFFWAISLNEVTGALIFQINGTQESQSGKTYASPSGGTCSFGFGLLQSTTDITGATGRIYNAAHWSRALSATELLNLYTAQKVKFGI